MQAKSIPNELIEIPYGWPCEPMYWKNELSGALAEAVLGYFNQEELSAEDLIYLKSYLLHWLKCPLFSIEKSTRERHEAEVMNCASREQISIITSNFISLGIDPF